METKNGDANATVAPEPFNSENPSENKEWEYNDMYPERRGGQYQRNWLKTIFLMEGKEEIKKMKCERNVVWCVKNSPIIKLMLGALRNAGCNFDIRRHVSCEMCYQNVTGGFDPELNQVVICQNAATTKGLVQGVLFHEMIHMFDYCKNELDFKNIDHLACTEIRAANLAHCSFLSAWMQGTAAPWRVKQRHQDCVKLKALGSVQAVKHATEAEAKEAIDRVFPMCYQDMEPLGRRIKRNSDDMKKAYLEGPLFGYEYKL